MGKAVRYEQCPRCAEEGHDNKGSNLSVFEDGGRYCNARHGVIQRSDGGVPETPPDDSEFLTGEYADLTSRRIRSDTCRKYRYQVFDSGHIANYFRNGKLVAQKIRKKGKDFYCVGNPNNAELFGQHTCRGEGGKWLVITEGELDCLTIAQETTHFDAVSLPGGVSTAREAIKKNLEFVNQYETVILAFDSDEPGQQAVDAVKDGLIRPGKLKIASLRYKDASEYLQRGKSGELVKDLWGASSYRPSGIVSGSEVTLDSSENEVIPYFDPSLSQFMLGREIYTSTAILSATGSGKTTYLKQMIDHDLKSGYSVGAILLEERPRETFLDIASLRLKKAIRKILRQRKALEVDPRIQTPKFVDDLDDDEIRREFGRVQTQSLYLWNPDEAPNYQAILDRMEYMSLGLGCKAIYLDHMSLMMFGEKKEIEGLDDFAVKFKALVLRCPSHFTVISQLSQGDGKKSHEEGGKISTRHMRGSQRVPSVFNEILALQRDMQADDEEDRNTTSMFCLKSRLGGETGHITSYKYDKQSGILNPAEKRESVMSLLSPKQENKQDFSLEEL